MVAMTYLAQNYASGSLVTIMTISEKTGISKIYLEQVFALLKRSGLVDSIKGSQGGYRLSRTPKEISAYDILVVLELTLMESTAPATGDKMPEIDSCLDAYIYRPMDEKLHELLASVSLEDILVAANKQSESLMYYI